MWRPKRNDRKLVKGPTRIYCGHMLQLAQEFQSGLSSAGSGPIEQSRVTNVAWVDSIPMTPRKPAREGGQVSPSLNPRSRAARPKAALNPFRVTRDRYELASGQSRVRFAPDNDHIIPRRLK
jgi:hypothetical protein